MQNEFGVIDVVGVGNGKVEGIAEGCKCELCLLDLVGIPIHDISAVWHVPGGSARHKVDIDHLVCQIHLAAPMQGLQRVAQV